MRYSEYKIKHDSGSERGVVSRAKLLGLPVCGKELTRLVTKKSAKMTPPVMRGVIGIVVLAVVMGMAVSCTSDKPFASEKFEEAAQIYGIEVESPTVLGDLVKISEAEFSGGLEDMGANEGRILEYANDIDYVLVMTFRFVSDEMARESFEELEEGTEVTQDLYEVEEGFYRYLGGDKIYLASGPANAVFTVLEGLASTSITASTPTTASTSTTQEKLSSEGSINAFAENWFWSKERNQDGKYGETRVYIELGEGMIEQATLYMTPQYSQQSGEANGAVYISSTQQVQPTDAEHDKGNYWYGNSASLGTGLGGFTCSYNAATLSFSITDFLNNNRTANTFYVAVKNEATADIGVAHIYIEATVK